MSDQGQITSSTSTTNAPLAPPCTPHAFPLTSLPSLLASRHPGTNLAEILRDSQWSVDAEMVEDPVKVALKGGGDHLPRLRRVTGLARRR
ncbi:uncharacterized protein SCHCODRAFT_02641689 [Schizophyllum commune H4-8]|nr:uncharacterized protein SCHCODRAFT_02641689 [Schizophyllum commune H4-8]KAI5886416.1 hypothetical protein SCHCODRAFT_02641689 [Schizophyllum commune H4-8]